MGPGGLHAEGHAGTDAARPVLSAQAHTSWDETRTARAVPCIYAQSLQVNPPNPAVCHGTLRLPLRGGSRSRTETPHRPYILILGHTQISRGYPPKYLETKSMEGGSKHKRLIKRTGNKLYTNEYIDERQKLANTLVLPARELPVRNTNSDEPLRFVSH